MATSMKVNEFVILEDPIKHVMTFPEAREAIKNTFAIYHLLLGEREAELLEKLDSFEAINRSKLEPLERDLKKLELTLEQVELNLNSNILMEFQLKQASEIRNQIDHFGTIKRSLDRVCLKWELSECVFDRIAEISIFRTRKEERETIAPLLKLEPREGDTWHMVNDSWFHKWKQAANLDSSDLTNDDGVMENIPIENFEVLSKDLDFVNITTLHSKAWDQLLFWHGLADGSVPVSLTSEARPTVNNASSRGARLKFSYRIVTKNNWGNVSRLYFSPAHTFQDVFTTVTSGLAYENKNIKMYARYIDMSPPKVIHKFVFGSEPLLDSDLITDFSAQIGTNTNLRFYFLVSNEK